MIFRYSSLTHEEELVANLDKEKTEMSTPTENKAIVGRWFTEFWGKTCNLGVVDDLAAPDMLLQYSLHAPRRGHDDIKAFIRTSANRSPTTRSFSGSACTPASTCPL